MPSLKIGYIVDPVEKLKLAKDTSVALMRESQNRGYINYVITLADLYLQGDRAMAAAHRISLGTQDAYELSEEEIIPMRELDVVLMRKDPPFDIDYIMATYILERLESNGTIVLNKPKSLRDINEKAVVSQFPNICPPCLLTSSAARIREFIDLHGKVVIKPTYLMGGQSVYILSKGDPNIPVIVEDVTLRGKRYAVLQKYIPEISTDGDQRIILINGKPMPYGIARIPKKGDHRGNMVTGAEAIGFELKPKHLKICDAIGQFLVRRGLFFVGIDVIGDYLTEVNITSPTGIIEIDRAFGTNIASTFFDSLTNTYL